FRIEGTWGVFDTGQPLELKMTGRDLLVVDTDHIRVRASPDVVVTQTDTGDYHVSGRVEVPLFLWFAEFGPKSEKRRKKEVEAPGLRLPLADGGGVRIDTEAGLEKITVDLEVISTGEIRIENSAVGALAEARARLKGRGSELALSGEGRFVSGELRLSSGLMLRIEEAEAKLPAEPGKAPTVHFQGSVGYGEGKVTLVASGPLEKPSLTFHSDPPRSQDELMRLLAFGRRGGSVEGQDAAVSFALKRYEQFTDNWPRAEPTESLISRLNISTPEKEEEVPWTLPPASTASTSTVRSEYVLSPYMSIIVETDLEGSWSGDLKLRLRFR
ncbi:MAG: translocation/assembly module TamB domain-containing protein, partial [Planctomycetota bacterium]